MLQREGGIEILQQVVRDPRSSEKVKVLLRDVLFMWENHKDREHFVPNI